MSYLKAAYLKILKNALNYGIIHCISRQKQTKRALINPVRNPAGI